MRYFVAVVEEKSFRRAAMRLHIAQPALSRAVQEVEGALESLLLLRSKNGVVPTDAGQVFFDGCQQVLRTVEDLCERVQRVRDGDVGRLVIGYTDFAISGTLPSLLQEFTSRYPKVHIVLEHMVTGVQLAALREGSIDVGFGTGPVYEPGISHSVVQLDRLVAVLSKRHRLASHKEIRLEQLANEAFVMGQSASWMHFLNHLSVVCHRAGFMPHVVQEAYNSEGIFGLVAADMGITLHVESARNYVRKGVVVRDLVDTEHVVPTVARWRDSNQSASLKNLVAFLRQHVRR